MEVKEVLSKLGLIIKTYMTHSKNSTKDGTFIIDLTPGTQQIAIKNEN